MRVILYYENTSFFTPTYNCVYYNRERTIVFANKQAQSLFG